MPGSDIWGSINTLFEIGIEIYRLTHEQDGVKSADKNNAVKDTEVKEITNGVLLMSNDKNLLIAVSKDAANELLSDTARAVGVEKGDYLIYIDAATAIPIFELSRVNEGVRDYIVSEESLRATLCGNYPNYVRTHNMNAPPGEQIMDADAPRYLFLQKQLDNAADETRSEVNAFQTTHERTSAFERSRYDDVLELER